MSDRSQRMGQEPVLSLLVKFSIPAVTGMVVQALYLIMNAFFVGNSHQGSDGLTAVTIGFPISLVLMGLGMLIGIGGSAAISIYLGQKDMARAEKVLGNSFTLSALISVAVTIPGLLFLSPLMDLMGASSNVKDLAMVYNGIIIAGTLPMTIAFGMNNFIRAEGNPNLSMVNMLISAVMNFVLDWLFIIVFGWGVMGAALATVLTQIVVSVLVIGYFQTKRSHVHLHFRYLAIDKEILFRIVGIGFSPFIMQAGAGFLQLLLNHQLKNYGEDVAIAAMSIVQRLTLFFFMPVFGINQASQPLIGYNYGAKNYLRVKATAQWAILFATAFVTIGFLVIHLFSEPLARAFINPADKNYQAVISLSVDAMRTFLLLMPLLGFQVVASGYFMSVGRAMTSTVLNLSRQFLFLIPLILILPHFLGIQGIWVAGPLADGLAALLTAAFFFWEFQHLGKKHTAGLS